MNMGWFESIAGNPTVVSTFLIFASTTMFTIFAKTIITIYRFGVSFRSQFVTKNEQKQFEKEMVSDMKDYKDELLKVVLSASMETIRDKLKDVDTIQNTANDMKLLTKELDIKIKNAMEKVDEVRSMGENVRSLGKRLDRMEYDQTTTEVRRKER
jgi:hypothetical protein